MSIADKWLLFRARQKKSSLYPEKSEVDIDYSGLLAQYSNKGRNGFNPIMMYATVVYAAMRGIRSVDTIVDLCKRDLAFIWFTQGKQPKRDAFYEFKNLRLKEISEQENIIFASGKARKNRRSSYFMKNWKTAENV